MLQWPAAEVAAVVGEGGSERRWMRRSVQQWLAAEVAAAVGEGGTERRSADCCIVTKG